MSDSHNNGWLLRIMMVGWSVSYNDDDGGGGGDGDGDDDDVDEEEW